jgi:hypothetical protein
VEYETALAPARERLARIWEALSAGTFTLREAFEAAIEIEESEVNRVFSAVCRLLAEVAEGAGRTDLAAAAREAGSEGSAHVRHLIETMKRTIGDPDLVRAARRALE